MHVCITYIMERLERTSCNRASTIQGAALTVGIVCLMATPLLWGQAPSQGLAALPSAEDVINRVQDPYLGSIPQGRASGETMDLTIEDAIDRGLKYNLGLYLSDRATDQSRAARIRALSEILPQISGSLSEEVEKLNLKALGFTGAIFPGVPTSVGPFSVFSLASNGSWNLVNLSSIDNVRAANENVKAAQFSYRDARDTVVLAVGANYLLTIASESRVEAAQAELKTAQALYQLASDQENAGLAPNIDTLRARVQLQTQQSVLIQAENDLEKQRIALARVIGLPVTQKVRLVNRVPYHPLPEVEVEGAYAKALQTRSDYQAALSLLRSAQLKQDSAWKERLPSIGLSGGYGVLGNQPSEISPNWTAAASLDIPIFQGGRIRSDIQQAQAVLKQRQAEADNLKARIEQEIQNALLDLQAAAKQVEVARTGLDYARQTVEQSQDRFSAGVTNNVEVIQAQQQLASANDQYIAGLYAHNIAKVLLARAMGNAEQAVKQYLSEPGSTAPTNSTPPRVNGAPSPHARLSNPPAAIGPGGRGALEQLRAIEHENPSAGATASNATAAQKPASAFAMVGANNQRQVKK